MSNPLLKDLPDLVKAGIITPEIAEKITGYYQSQKDNPSNRFNIVLGILGSLLAGSGIILLVAHNWDDFNRLTQTILAFLPLLVTQGLCLYTLLRKKESVVWRESSASLLFFAVAACIALISQIYNISGSLSGFILTWMLLAVPLVYVLSSSLVSLLVIACGTWYACLVGYGGVFDSFHTSIPWFYVVLLLVILPHYYRYARYNRTSNFFHLHNWMLAISLIITLGAFSEHYSVHYIFLGYLGLFCLYYLVGNTDYFISNKLFANPLLITGTLGCLCILMIRSFNGLWDTSIFEESGFFDSSFAFVILAILLAVAYFSIKHNKQQFDPVGFSPFLFLIALFISKWSNSTGSFLINAWVIAIGIYFIRKGSIRNHLGILNFGLLIIAILALLRFFDESIPFIWRGIFFLATGIGFFVANYLMLKKRKSVTQNTSI
jgi:uncharacterized membrane protein